MKQEVQNILETRSDFNFSKHWGHKGTAFIDVKNASNNLIDCNEIMSEIGLNAWLMYGTLLGIYRDGELISYDRDVDMGVWRRDQEKILEMISRMEAIGFRVIRIYPYLFSMMRDKEYIDFSIFEELEGGRCLTKDIVEAVDTHYFDSERFFVLDAIEYKGKTLLVPNNPEKLLVEWYGEDWKIPQVDKYAYF